MSAEEKAATSAPEKQRVLLIDDHPMFTEGLARILADHPRLVAVGTATDRKRAFDGIRKLRPDCIVLDYELGQTDGAELCAEIKAAHPRLPIVALTMHANVHYALRMIEAGAKSFVVKSAAPEQLIEAIEQSLQGVGYVSPTILPFLTAYLSAPDKTGEGIRQLSQREFQMLRFIAKGYRLQDCADAMNVTVSTASTYRARVLKKLGFTSTAELIRYALDHQIVG